jgi:predicted nucleic acid-binding protein
VAITRSLFSDDKIYLDTNAYVYFLEDNPQFADQIDEIFKTCLEQDIQIFASCLISTELLVAPFKEGRKDLVALYQNLERQIPNLNLVTYNQQIAVKSAYLRAKYDIKTPDAIHIATAWHYEVEAFYTGDQKLKKVTEVPIRLIRPNHNC